MNNLPKKDISAKDTHWNLIEEFVRIGSKWVTLIGEKWRCDKGNVLEYWRVEKVDSVIVLPLLADHIICPSRVFRPGVGRPTLDFPGGRLPKGIPPDEIVPDLLEKELNIPRSAISKIQQINDIPLLVNSSFSNQRLWGYTAVLDQDSIIPEFDSQFRFTTDESGLHQLLMLMECLQCRGLLLEWMRKRSRPEIGS